MNIRTIIGSSAVAVAAFALSACGSDSEGAANTLPADVGLEIDAGPGIKFGSESYTSAAGDVVVALVNKDTQRHTLVIVGPDGATLPGHLEVTKSGSFETNEFALAPGEYKLICDVPGHEAMKATLTVR